MCLIYLWIILGLIVLAPNRHQYMLSMTKILNRRTVNSLPSLTSGMPLRASSSSSINGQEHIVLGLTYTKCQLCITLHIK